MSRPTARDGAVRRSLVAVAARLIPLAVALGLSFALFAASGFDVVPVASGLLEGSLTGRGAVANTVRWAVPLCLIGLGIAVCLRAGEFNIGAQGQMQVGSLLAVWVALEWDAPKPLVILLAALLAVVGGSAWSGLAGVLKVRLGADEVITTLMLNFVALQLVQWVTTGPLKDLTTSGDSASTSRIDPSLRVQGSGEISVAVLAVTALAAVGTWLLLERSRLGLHLSYVGGNSSAAVWQGLPLARVRLIAYLVAGALAGLTGAVEVFGPAGRVVTGATPLLGFTALVVTVVASYRVAGTVVTALFFGGLQAAVLYLPIVSDLPVSGLRIVEGLVAMLITARLAVMLRRRRHNAALAPTASPEAGRAGSGADQADLGAESG